MTMPGSVSTDDHFRYHPVVLAVPPVSSRVRYEAACPDAL